MDKHLSEDRLSIIANLLALQIVQDKSLVDASWILSRAGMEYFNIGLVLGISEKSVSAHVSNKRKQLEKTTKAAKKPRAKEVENE